MTAVVDETLNALQDPELLSTICAHVIEGGTLVGYCAEHALKYKLIVRWIADDKERGERYANSLITREQHAKDLIIAELISYLRAKPVDAFVMIGGNTEGGIPAQQALKALQDMPADLQRLIAGIEFEEIFEMQGERGSKERVHVGRIHKIKFWDKPRAIENFMKHLAMLVDRKEITGKISLADLIAGEEPKAVKTT
jgi:hypothetical protein